MTCFFGTRLWIFAFVLWIFVLESKNERISYAWLSSLQMSKKRSNLKFPLGFGIEVPNPKKCIKQGGSIDLSNIRRSRYIYIIYTRSFKDPKNCRPSEKKIVFSRKNGFLVKNPYFGFCWICTNLSKLGGPVSNFSSLHVAVSYWQLVKSVRQNARSKPKQALSDTMRAFSTDSSYLYAVNFPFSGTGGSQKVTMDMHGISKVSFSDMNPVNWQ